MKNLILVFILLLIPVYSFAFTEITDKHRKQVFRDLILANNYDCRFCNKIFVYGKSQRGIVFKAVCNNWEFMYRVILTPNNKFIIKPWREK